MLRRTLLAGAFILVMPSAVAAAQSAELEIVQPEQLALTFDGGESDKASVWVRNTTDQTVDPVFSADVEDADGDSSRLLVVVVDEKGVRTIAKPLAAGSVRRYRVFVRPPAKTESEDVSGVLVIQDKEGSGSVPAAGTVPVTVGKKPFAAHGVTAALWWPAVPALVLILVAGFRAIRRKDTDLTSPLPPDLDFKTAYASTVTAAGALLATVIAASVLPEQTTTLSKEAFLALNLIFGIAVVVAGLVYAALQRPVWVDVPNTTKQQRAMEGTVWGFLAASFITVWAVFGELLTLWLLLDELGQDQGFTESSLNIFKVLIAGATLAMAVYTLQRIPAIVASERAKPDPAPARGQVKSGGTRTIQPAATKLDAVSML
jgi:hypothetical protein